MEKTRLVHQLDTPFTAAPWPVISQQDQESILDLLCTILSPIGQHREAHIKPSKGKRRAAQKRKRDQAEGDAKKENDVVLPPPPAVAACVDVGLSQITKTLQSRAEPDHLADAQETTKSIDTYTLVFVVRSGPPSAFFDHLPQMVAVASKAWALSEPVRLVGFSKSCGDRLSACLGIPRVTSLAIRRHDTAQLKALVDFVQARVPPVCAPWLEEAGLGEFRPSKINTLQAHIGKKRQKA